MPPQKLNIRPISIIWFRLQVTLDIAEHKSHVSHVVLVMETWFSEKHTDVLKLFYIIEIVSRFNYISPFLRQLHWLKAFERIDYN